jgi:hypothetical protein
VTKKKIDCNWYCLQKCSTKNLRPMLNIPKFMFDVNDERVSVLVVRYTFSTSISELTFEIETDSESKEISWELEDREKNKLISDHEGSNLNTLAGKLCRWLKRQDYDTIITLSCTVISEDEDFFDAHDFFRFDIPFIRPNSMWSRHSPIMTTFEISQKN